MTSTCPSCGYVQPQRPALSAAIDEVIRLREGGWSFADIGAAFGCSRQRVQQVITKHEAATGLKVAPRETKAQRRARIRQEVRASRDREREAQWMSNVGQRFGSLVVTDMLREPDLDGHLQWKAVCRCDCGVVSKVGMGNLANGRTQSCGSKGHPHKRGWYRISAPMNVIHVPEGHP